MAIRNDEPIECPEDDLLGRAHLGKIIAGEIRNLDASRGAVIGVLGPWGSGKTSLLNLMRTELNKQPPIAVLDFNPWLFSGADQLISSFFVEMAAQLRVGPEKLASVADRIANYGEAVAPFHVLPIVGGWIALISGATRSLQSFVKTQKGGVVETRKKLIDVLRTLDAPIVVILDDGDRLSTNEIRDVFKLVRLTASFPNVIYVVAFDRARVEQALNEQGFAGRDYLEKIIQITYDIPVVPLRSLTTETFAAINESLSDIENPGQLDQFRWPDVYAEIIQPLIRTVRDVRRFSASVHGTVKSLNGQVELVDVLGLEAIRIFSPSDLSSVIRHREALTEPGRGIFPGRPDQKDEMNAASVRSWIEELGVDKVVVESMLRRLFPAAYRHIANEYVGADSLRSWLLQKRVAHRDMLGYYLERVASPGLESHWNAARALGFLSDVEQFEGYLRSIDQSNWEELIGALESFEDELPADGAEAAIVVLLNLLPEIPERPRGVLEFGPRTTVKRVVLRFLRRIPGPADVELIVRRALPQIRELSGKFELLGIAGHEENRGHQLISEEASRELERSLRDTIRNSPPEAIARESDLLRLLMWVKKSGEESETEITLREGSLLESAILKAAVSEDRIQAFGTRASRAERVLLWDSLVWLVGGENVVRRIVASCEDQVSDSELQEAVELAKKYLSGWRPEH